MAKKIKTNSLFLAAGVIIIVVGIFVANSAGAVNQKIFGIRVMMPETTGNVVTIQWHTTLYSDTHVEYGTVSGNYTKSKEKAGAYEDFHGISFRVEYNTTYYYRIVATDLDGNAIYSEEQSFKALKKEIEIEKIEVRNITSSSALINITLNREGYATVQYGASPNNLTAELRSTSTNDTASRSRQVQLKGLMPENMYYFKVTANTPFSTSTEKAVSSLQSFTTLQISPLQPTVQHISSFADCNISTNARNANTLKVKTLFTKESETDKYLQSVYDAYNKEWGREPRCDELQFHLDHSTSIEKLTEWLKGKVITERFGCKISTSSGSDDTLLVKDSLTLGSETNKYLESVVNAYTSIWGRDPRCDELQFHLDHSTSLTRLKSWLEENKPSVTAKERKEIIFSETDGKIVLKDPARTLQFGEADIITFSGKTIPNAFVALTISSEPIIATVLSNDKGDWSFALSGPLEAGDHTVKIVVSDKDGNKISESDAVSFKIRSSVQQPKISARRTPPLWVAGIISLFLILFLGVLLVKMKRLKSKSN